MPVHAMPYVASIRQKRPSPQPTSSIVLAFAANARGNIHGIEHIAATKIAVLTHVRDPSGRGFVPTSF
jgi:hypothetical protein